MGVKPFPTVYYCPECYSVDLESDTRGVFGKHSLIYCVDCKSWWNFFDLLNAEEVLNARS
jgi:hypothetical protein